MNGKVGKASIEEVINIRIVLPGRLAKPLVFILCLYRRLRYGYSFRRIPLTRGLYAIVDVEDYDRLASRKWFAQASGRMFYAARWGHYPRRRLVWMHREVLEVPDDMLVDHINRNSLDNHKANLRPATRSQNNWNQRRHTRKKSSKYKGVTMRKRTQKWSADIQANRKRISLGEFDNEIDAAKAYDNAAKKYHGQFAAPNFT